MVMSLEGGYHLDGLRDSVKATLQQLAAGAPVQGIKVEGTTASSTGEIIESVRGVHKAFWPSL